MTSALSTAQIVTIVLTFVSVVSFVVGSAYWLNSSSYRVLYADMDPEAASQLVAQLRSRDVPFRLDDGGRAIRVPSTRIDELRLELAGEGLPASGRIGFEIFDRTAFGVTEFLEHVNYRRALEGEIARTISTLSEVSSARVHIAMAQESLFATRSEPAKASVVLKRRNKQPLSQSAVIGITNLVAASVEGLRAEAVVLLDSFGNPLSRPPGDNDEPLGNAQGERQRRLEADLSNRVVTLLEPVVGLNRVRVDVSARLNPESAELTEERWDPDTVVRSRQVTTEVGTPTLPTSGVAGASANIRGPVTNVIMCLAFGHAGAQRQHGARAVERNSSGRWRQTPERWMASRTRWEADRRVGRCRPRAILSPSRHRRRRSRPRSRSR